MRPMQELAASIPSSGSSPASSGAHAAVFLGYPLVSALLAFAMAQSAKIFTTWYNERRWDPKRLIGSGGMPSSHSATVVALAVAIGLHEGLGSSAFATATILAAVLVMLVATIRDDNDDLHNFAEVICDASGVRLHAGKQAAVLNQIVYELPEGHPLCETKPLRELLGHTPLQVTFGAVLGCIVAIALQLISRFAGTAWQSKLINTLIYEN